MFRLFVGIALPEEAHGALALLCNGLPGAKWVEPDNMHISLRFIGEVDGGTGQDIDSALCRIAAPAFSLTLSGVDCFAQASRVRVLWAGVGKEPLLVHLREKVESALVRSGLEPDRRKFKPHVTLARFKNGVSDRLGSYMQRHSRFLHGPFPITAFTLYQSHLGSRGAHYETIAEYELERGAAHAPQPLTAPRACTRT
jgi:RNA 2',3'-cyclic 3'-phosphodiesterase